MGVVDPERTALRTVAPDPEAQPTLDAENGRTRDAMRCASWWENYIDRALPSHWKEMIELSEKKGGRKMKRNTWLSFEGPFSSSLTDK